MVSLSVQEMGAFVQRGREPVDAVLECMLEVAYHPSVRTEPTVAQRVMKISIKPERRLFSDHDLDLKAYNDGLSHACSPRYGVYSTKSGRSDST
jgi:hypothetical protein